MTVLLPVPGGVGGDCCRQGGEDPVRSDALDDEYRRKFPLDVVALENLDVEVARWERAGSFAGVRGGSPGTITFTVDNLTLMVNFTSIGARHRRAPPDEALPVGAGASGTGCRREDSGTLPDGQVRGSGSDQVIGSEPSSTSSMPSRSHWPSMRRT